MRAQSEITCNSCGNLAFKALSEVLRIQSKNGKFYCSRSCAAKGRKTVFSRRGSKYSLKSDLWQDTELISYFMGFCCADGSMTLRDGQYVHDLSFYSTDRHIIEDISKRLGLDRPVSLNRKSQPTKSGGQSKDCWSNVLHSTNAQMFSDFGFKSVKAEQSLKTFGELDLRHFLRGLIDGDGHIGKGGRNGSVNLLTFPKLVDDLQITLPFDVSRFEQGVLSGLVIKQGSWKDLYSFLYDDATLYLIRKKEAFETLLR